MAFDLFGVAPLAIAVVVIVFIGGALVSFARTDFPLTGAKTSGPFPRVRYVLKWLTVWLVPAVIMAGFVEGTTDRDAAQKKATQAHLLSKVTDKYRVEIYPNTTLDVARSVKVDLVGYVDGQAHDCTLRFMAQDEPVVFCGTGKVEADRSR